MDSSIMVALVVGTLSVLGTFINSKYTSNVRVVKLEMKMDELERKVSKHNQLVERMYSVENKVCLLEKEMGEVEKRTIPYEC